MASVVSETTEYARQQICGIQLEDDISDAYTVHAVTDPCEISQVQKVL